MGKLVNSAYTLLKCERASLFHFDPAIEEFKCIYSKDIQGVRVAYDHGIIGSTLKKGSVLNIQDAYKDKRFSQAVDMHTGFKTQAVLSVPIYAMDGRLLAVLQAVNKTDDEGSNFTPQDEATIAALAKQAGKLLGDALWEERTRVEMLELSEFPSLCYETSDLCNIIVQKAQVLTGVSGCCIYWGGIGQPEPHWNRRILRWRPSGVTCTYVL